tara:strand:+ start:1253 stop:1975 length:723 start_codon:yes stop_codon:yes gene_type:complete
MKPIEVYDTSLVSKELFDETVFLPYLMCRSDDGATKENPDIDIKNNYWTHQLYNYKPASNPNWFEEQGIGGSDHPLYKDVLTFLEAVIPMPPRDKMYSAYINLLRFGDRPGIHVDCPWYVTDQKTVLIYLNPEWQPEWGGETIFYNHKMDATRIVTPRPGRVVMFDGRIPHTGRPPTPRYERNRYILTFKYMDLKIRDDLFDKFESTGNQEDTPDEYGVVEDLGIEGVNTRIVKDLDLTF